MKNFKCEKCGSEAILNHINYCECVECGNTFLTGLEKWFSFFRF